MNFTSRPNGRSLLLFHRCSVSSNFWVFPYILVNIGCLFCFSLVYLVVFILLFPPYSSSLSLFPSSSSFCLIPSPFLPKFTLFSLTPSLISNQVVYFKQRKVVWERETRRLMRLEAGVTPEDNQSVFRVVQSDSIYRSLLILLTEPKVRKVPPFSHTFHARLALLGDCQQTLEDTDCPFFLGPYCYSRGVHSILPSILSLGGPQLVIPLSSGPLKA